MNKTLFPPLEIASIPREPTPQKKSIINKVGAKSFIKEHENSTLSNRWWDDMEEGQLIGDFMDEDGEFQNWHKIGGFEFTTKYKKIWIKLIQAQPGLLMKTYKENM